MSKISDPIILIVDTDAASAAASQALLTSHSYQVHNTPSPSRALEIAACQEIDLVICDLNVDGTDGQRLVEEIRALPNRSDVPVMFATSAQSPDIIRKFHGSSASFHLKKPISPQILLELVDRALWMPHLVQNHLEQQKEIRKPHFPIPGSVLDSTTIAKATSNLFN